MPFEDVSTYMLIRKLAEPNGAVPDKALADATADEIFQALESRHNRRFGGDVGSWMTWFLENTSVGTQKEKAALAATKWLLDSRRNCLGSVGG